jgi:tetratricopeptide (TPR) repeat protein
LRRALDALKGIFGRRRTGAPPRVVIRATRRAPPQLPPPVDATPDLIPAPPEDFTGRPSELADLVARVEAGAAIINLQGMAGVGRTSLALKLAAELSPRFPDGRLLIDLGGAGRAPESRRAAALARALRPYYPDAILPAEAAELADLLGKTLRGRRVLLLAEDARGTEEIAPLRPSVGSLLIFTSREAIKVASTQAKYLTPLRPNDAAALLDRLAPGMGELAAETARVCGCLPFVLRLAGWALSDRLDLNSTEFAARLAEARKGGTLIDGALALAEELLSYDARALWRELSGLPADFDAAAAAAMGGLEEEPAGAALTELSLAGVIVSAGRGGRLRLHGLARARADSGRSDAERAETRMRHAVHYLRVLRRAEKLCGGKDGSPEEGLALLDAEWENIAAGQAWAAAGAAGDDTLAHLVCDYALAGGECLRLRRTPVERIGWLESALAAARRMGLRATEPAHLFSLGTVHTELGDLESAATCFEQCLKAAGRLTDRRGECAALGGLAAVLWDQGRKKEAAAAWKRQLKLAGGLRDRRTEAGALGRLALAATAAGDRRGARKFAERHLNAVREIGDRPAELAGLGSLGAACAAVGDSAGAAECFERQAALAGDLNDTRAAGVALANLSAVAGKLDEPRRAIACHEQFLAFARKTGDRAGELAAVEGLAAACHRLGEYERTVEYCQRQAGMARELGQRRSEVAALGNAAAAWRAAGEHSRALEAGEKHLELARAAADRRAEAAALAGLGSSLAAQGEFGRAAERYEEHLSVLRSMGEEGAAPAPAVLGGLGLAYYETEDDDNAARCFREQLAAARAAGERRSEGNALYNLSLVLDRLGERDAAIAKLETALKVYKSIRDPSARLAGEQLARWKD